MSHQKASPLLVIVGPTASGKSALGMYLARKYDGEIICADSRTIYQGMDVGTAKPTPDDQALVRHHLLDVVEPNQTFSAGQFKQLAIDAIADITSRGKLPILVGGTGLYVDAVLYDYQFPAARNERLAAEWANMSVEELQKLAEDANITGLSHSDWANKRRLMRALELQNTPAAVSSKRTARRSNSLVIGLTLNKEVIQKRIAERIVFMLKKGLIDEVRRIGDKFGWDAEALTGNCYRAFKVAAIAPKPTPQMIEDASADCAAADMRLVKKQLTWFRRHPDIIWLDGADAEVAQRAAEQQVSQWLHRKP